MDLYMYIVCAVLSEFLCGFGVNYTAIFKKTKRATALIFTV